MSDPKTNLDVLGRPHDGADTFGFHWLLFDLMDPVVGAWHPQRGVAPNGYWSFTCGSIWRPEAEPRRCAYLGQAVPPSHHPLTPERVA